MSAPLPFQTSELWQRLAAYEIGPGDEDHGFAARLARENRWSEHFTQCVIEEYKRFCYLACTSGQEVTPSDAVDQAWHLHLTYSRDYWQVFCPQILQADLHHGPTSGGRIERERYYDQYAETLAAYESTFGDEPPPDIWPGAARRFGKDQSPYRVNPADVMVLDRRNAILGAFGWVAIGIFIAVFLGFVI